MFRFCSCPRQVSVSVIPIRTKKYYDKWKTPDYLDDIQNLARATPDTYSQWQTEWHDKNSVLQALDIHRLPKRLKEKHNSSEKFYEEEIEDTPLDYKRRLFGIYGAVSGVNPAQLFYTKKTLALEKLKYEYLEEPVSVFIQNKGAQDKVKAKKLEEKLATIRSGLERMPKLLARHDELLKKQADIKLEREAKKQQLLEEARDKFGYRVDVRDAKFHKLKMDKEEQDKESKRIERKEKKGKV